MAAIRFWLLSTTIFVVAAALHHEEDFAFETEEQDSLIHPHVHHTATPVQRLWGIPDTTATVGRLFQLEIPNDAFSGNIDHYEARGPGGVSLPSWLRFDAAAGKFEGVPGSQDIGEHYVTIRALGLRSQDWAKDVFSIEVVTKQKLHMSSRGGLHHKSNCNSGEDPTVLTLIMDAKFEHMKPKQRVAAINNLAGFLSLSQDLFQLGPANAQENLMDDSVVLAGPGNVKKKTSKSSTGIQWQVGCDGHLWHQHSQYVQQLKQNAKDGTLAEVLQQPIVGWYIKTETSPEHRERREAGSGDFDDEFGDEDDPDEDEEMITESELEAVPSVHIVPTMPTPVFPEATATHHHRHHHGEVEHIPDISIRPEVMTNVAYRLPTSPFVSILQTPTLVPVRPTLLVSNEILVEPSRTFSEFAEITPSATPVFVSEVEPSVTTDMPTSQQSLHGLEETDETQVTEPLPPSSSSSSSSSPSPTTSTGLTSEMSTGSSSTSETAETTSTTEESSPSPFFVPEEKSTTEKPTTEHSSTFRTTEEIEYGVKNIKPTIDHRLPRQVAIAGKAFRYTIPEDTFSDLEDGNTRNLRLIFKTSNGTSVPTLSWIQFNPETQEVYGLPLEEHVSKWVYVIEAMDKDGSSVSDNLEVIVQHHKGRRTVNYEFSLLLRVEKKFDFPSPIDYQLRVLDSLARLYGDPDTKQIVVRNVSEDAGPVTFTWTNETLPRNYCPKDEIDKLFQVLSINEDGDPSHVLKEILQPAFRPKKVSYRGIGHCEQQLGRAQPPQPPPRTPQHNFPPVTRNQVDHINATVGKLLVFIVPEDSFYDPEDGPTRNLKLSLLTIDRGPIPSTYWLQFDVKNQEFYGIPLPGDEGRREYQLVCEDHEGLTAHDSLVVVVHPAPRIQYTVEFGMKLDVPHETFMSSASMKRKFVEKLRMLFGDPNTNSIFLSNITEGSTLVTWHNRSLPTDTCPEGDIKRLRRMLINDDSSISNHVGLMMGPEFNVRAITLIPTGMCQGEMTPIHTPDGPGPPVDETQHIGTSDEYLVTFVVPAVIIAAMLILAGIVACVLYRRRRTGKMNVGDEDERQSFRNKGIPVIFQDELEERPDPGNKSPVIMKEEKPPLPPPEYQRGGGPEPEHPVPPPSAAHPLLGENNASEDPPYQPPPPFTTSRDSGRQNRPKPTPTYRKPPPYVPP